MEKVSTDNRQNITSKRSDLGKAAVILFLVIILAAGGWYADHSKQKPSSTNKTSPVWVEFSSQKYGLKFNYLKTWGTPNFHVASQQSPGSSSATPIYSIFFSDLTSNQKRPALFITFSPDAPPINNCAVADKNCPTTSFLSGNLIKTMLSQDKKHFVKYTDNSFAVLTYPPSDHTGVLNIAQIVHLSKLGVSAASLSYTLNNVSQSCPKSQLAQNTQTQCITQTDYSDFSQALGSLSSL